MFERFQFLTICYYVANFLNRAVQHLKWRCIFELNLVCFSSWWGKMYSAALHKVPTQTVDSSQVLQGSIRRSQPEKLDRETKIGTKDNHRYGTGVLQTIPAFSLLFVVVKSIFAQKNVTFLMSHLLCTLNFVKIENCDRRELKKIALFSPKCSVFLCRNGYFKHIHSSFYASYYIEVQSVSVRALRIV